MVAAEDTVVVIEDDHHISDLVAMYLRRDGFRVLQADEAESGLALVDRERPKLVIVDIGLPGDLDGFDVCRRLRNGSVPPGGTPRGADPRTVPVLILSARDDEVDRVLGLELGADDYVTKPFSARELVARVHAILRRTEAPAAAPVPLVTLGAIEVDTRRREVRRSGTRPTAHSCTMTSRRAGGPPASSHACAVPSVGWPANGRSRVGVKILTR